MQRKPLGSKILRSSRFPVNHGQHVCRQAAYLPQLPNRLQNPSAGSNNIFHNNKSLAGDATTLSQLSSAISLWFLSDEEGRDTGDLRKHSGYGDSAHFQAGQSFHGLRDQFRHFFDDGSQKDRIRFEQVFVEVVITCLSRAEAEFTFEV